jgi:GNAT superfamily N-acetyltransferase
MYVRPDIRNAGIGRQLVEAVIDYARDHVEVIQLGRQGNEQRRLYAFSALSNTGSRRTR